MMSRLKEKEPVKEEVDWKGRVYLPL